MAEMIWPGRSSGKELSQAGNFISGEMSPNTPNKAIPQERFERPALVGWMVTASLMVAPIWGGEA